VNGYVAVDYDAAVWLEIPPCWDERWPDHRTWARGIAEMCWKGLKPGEHEVDNLALGLALCAERWGPDAVEAGEIPFDAYLHLPDPRGSLLPVLVYTIADETPDESELSEYVGADDPAAIGPVEVEAFETTALGKGLRAFRRFNDEDGTLNAAVRYAWRLTQPPIVIVVAVSADEQTVRRAGADIDNFAQAVRWLEVAV
jgi:hypothetical protein